MKKNDLLKKGKRLLYVAILLIPLLISNKGYTQCNAPATTEITYIETNSIGMNDLYLLAIRAGGVNSSGAALFVSTTNSFTIPATSTTINTLVPYNSLLGGQQQVYSTARVDPGELITGLKANTTYYYKYVGYNLCNGTYYYEQTGREGSATTCGNDNLVTNPLFSSVTASSMTLSSFTAPTSGNAPTGYVVKMNTTNSFTPIASHAAVPSGNAVYGGGEQVVYGGTSSTPNVTITGLTGNTDYYFTIYAYFEGCSGRRYQQTGYGFSKYNGNNKILPLITQSDININTNEVFTFEPTSVSTGSYTYQIISETGTSTTYPTLSGNTLTAPASVGTFTLEVVQAPNTTHLGATKTVTVNVSSGTALITPTISFVSGELNPPHLLPNAVNLLYFHGTINNGPVQLGTQQAISSNSPGAITYSMVAPANGYTITGSPGAEVLNLTDTRPNNNTGIIKAEQAASGNFAAHTFYFGATFFDLASSFSPGAAPLPVNPITFSTAVNVGDVIDFKPSEPKTLTLGLANHPTTSYQIVDANPSGSFFTDGVLTIGQQHGASASSVKVRITVTYTGGSVYEPTATRDVTIAINPVSSSNQAQEIVFPELNTAAKGDVINLTGYSTSGLPITYVSSNTSVATISGNELTIIAKGATNITASQAGDVTFAAATDVIRPLTTIGTAQSITFNALPDANLGVPYALSATASSNLAVSFSSSDPTIASVSGNTVTPLKLGSVTITASQAGDSTYDIAPNQTQTLTVANPTITTTQAIALTSASINCGNTSSTTVTNSQNIAVKYYLRDNANNGIVSAPVVGNGSTITLTDDYNATTSKTYNVLATHGNSDQINAFQFDGQDGYVSFPGAFSSEIGNNITVETKALIPADHSSKTEATLIGQTYRIGSNSSQLSIYVTSGQLYTAIIVNSTRYISDAVSYTADQWMHIAATYDGTNLILYIDGVAQNTKALSSVTLPATTNDWYIGRLSNTSLTPNSANHFGGKLADTRIWNTTRTATQILNDKDRSITSASNLVLSYQFVNGAGSSTTTNLAGNTAYNGTLTNLLTDTTTWLPNTGAVQMDNTASLTVNELPTDNSVTFTNTLGHNPIITVANTTLGLIYSLREGTTVIGSTITSTGGNISFPEQTISANTTYNVYVSPGGGNTVCDRQLTNTAAVTYVPPTDQMVTVSSPQTIDCTTQSTTISLANSQSTAKYYLRDNETQAVIDGPITGTGAALPFTAQTLTGVGTSKTYNVFGSYLHERINQFQFNGDGYVTIPSAMNSEISNAITVETEAYIPASESTKIWTPLVTQKIGSAGTIKFTIFLHNENLRVGYHSGGWAHTQDIPYTSDQWIHIAATFDGTTIRVYLDGVHQDSFDYTPDLATRPIPVAANGEPWYLGSRWDNESSTAYKFAGKLSNTRIWNVARSGTEINANKDKPIATDTNLVAGYQYGTGSGTTVKNSTGNAAYDGVFTGTLTGWIAHQGGQMTTTPTVTVTTYNNNVSLFQPTGSSARVTVENSFTGVNYTLRNGTTVIGSPVAGTGGNITFPDHSFSSSSFEYNVLAERASETTVCDTQLPTTVTANLISTSLTVKVFLQGPYNATSNLMDDGLRSAGVIPTTSPYGDGATVLSTVFDATGNIANDIVDWVYIELRDKNDITTVIATIPALLQRDGDVVALDGVSTLTAAVTIDSYYIVVGHRNHLSIATNTTVALSASTPAVDFTNATSSIRGTTNAVYEVETGVFALFAGNSDTANTILNPNDRSTILTSIGTVGYNINDVNMNNIVQPNDRSSFTLSNIGKARQF